ncbi:Cyclin-dependent kinase 6 [Halotydeus destructor]|nr:Cyclin-dependent kinase 6 [Halotydeus destructor]
MSSGFFEDVEPFNPHEVRMDKENVMCWPFSWIKLGKDVIASGGFGKVLPAKIGHMGGEYVAKYFGSSNTARSAAEDEFKNLYQIGYGDQCPFFCHMVCFSLKQNKVTETPYILFERHLYDLAGYRRRCPKWHVPERELACIFVQVCTGLHWLHNAHGMAHCDIKAANLLVTREGNVLISDFGLSKSFRFGHISATPVGTRGYRHPYLLDETKHSIDGALDYWSLAMTLWFLRTGDSAYPNDIEGHYPCKWALEHGLAYVDGPSKPSKKFTALINCVVQCFDLPQAFFEDLVYDFVDEYELNIQGLRNLMVQSVDPNRELVVPPIRLSLKAIRRTAMFEPVPDSSVVQAKKLRWCENRVDVQAPSIIWVSD